MFGNDGMSCIPLAMFLCQEQFCLIVSPSYWVPAFLWSPSLEDFLQVYLSDLCHCGSTSTCSMLLWPGYPPSSSMLLSTGMVKSSLSLCQCPPLAEGVHSHHTPVCYLWQAQNVHTQVHAHVLITWSASRVGYLKHSPSDEQLLITGTIALAWCPTLSTKFCCGFYSSLQTRLMLRHHDNKQLKTTSKM